MIRDLLRIKQIILHGTNGLTDFFLAAPVFHVHGRHVISLLFTLLFCPTCSFSKYADTAESTPPDKPIATDTERRKEKDGTRNPLDGRKRDPILHSIYSLLYDDRANTREDDGNKQEQLRCLP